MPRTRNFKPDVARDEGSLPIVALVGRANVGKSSLLNKLAGWQLSITSDIAGTTRDRVSTEVEWNHRRFVLVDTGGLDRGGDQLEEHVTQQAQNAIASAQVILFVVDVRAGLLPSEQTIGRMLRRATASIIVVANKAERREHALAREFDKLGFGEIARVSAHSGAGTGDLLDAIVKNLPRTEKVEKQHALRIALVGQPNVGKSSIVNALANQESTIVSAIPGTTRDTTTTRVRVSNEQYDLLDTAGLTRPGRAKELQRFAALRTIKTMYSADICLLVVSAATAITLADKRAARNILDARKPCLIVANKADLVSKSNLSKVEQHIRSSLPLLDWAPLLLVSASKKTNLEKIFDRVSLIAASQQRIVPEEALKTFTNSILRRQKIPRGRGPRYARLIDLEQTPGNLPRFVVHVDFPEAVHGSYLKFIENRLRSQFDFTGTPLQFVLQKGRVRRT
jgi:GTP-binding protein